MSARAPQAILDLWDDIQTLVPKAVLSGVVGDVNHSFGYHLARQDLPGSDYSVELTADTQGAADCASALDVTLPADLMMLCTGRLVHAARANDPRLRALREFCGTLNGTDTFPWQLVPTNGSEGLGTWDDSHLWHIHLSFLREFADDYDALAPIAEVFGGVSTDPLEELMAQFYKDRDEFEAAMAKIAKQAVNDRFDEFARDHDGTSTGLRRFLLRVQNGDYTEQAAPATD